MPNLTTGREIRGGCDDCLAWTTVELPTRQLEGRKSVFFVKVHHDKNCPWNAQATPGDPVQPNHEIADHLIAELLGEPDE